MKKNIIIYSILIVIIIILLFLLYKESKNNSLLYEELKMYNEKYKDDKNKEIVSEKYSNNNKEDFNYDYFDLESTEDEIWNTYNNNLLVGTKKYTNKRIKTTVNFVSFTSDYNYKGDIKLIINFNKSYCDSYLEEENIDLTSLTKGKEIIIIGSINSYLDSNQKIKFERCKIIM